MESLHRRRLGAVLKTEILDVTPVSGGCVSHALRVETPDGIFFAKFSEDSNSTFQEEAAGLRALASEGLKVPEVLHANSQLLVTEWIESEPPQAAFWRRLGQELANLHKRPREEWGFAFDNHLGSTLQRNMRHKWNQMSWGEYFIKYRLEALATQTEARAQNLLREKRGLIRACLDAMTEPPSLVHGDLWSGNVLCSPGQTPVLIDAAPYWGHREVDLAMSELFGGFADEFYIAYREAFPLSDGYERRREIYNLYHLLNHWILFGESYRARSLALLESI
ncbi:MAG: fructosamine kinase family protein [Bdellovibrionales bacterium]